MSCYCFISHRTLKSYFLDSNSCLYVFDLQSEAGVKCRKFSDLSQLIQQYIQRGQKNGLAGPLLHPVMVDENDDEIGIFKLLLLSVFIILCLFHQ